ncbi:MAG: hypothetical protein ACI4P4_06395, partial [Faecousia sp.]
NDTTQIKYFQEFLKAAMTFLSRKAFRKFCSPTNSLFGDIRFQFMAESQNAQIRGIRNRTRKKTIYGEQNRKPAAVSLAY